MTDTAPEKKKPKIKPSQIVLWCVLGVILLPILIYVSTLLVEKYILKQPVPMFAGYASLVVISGSMSGAPEGVEKGDLIIIKKTDDYKITDVVTYVNSGNEVVTHRLVNNCDPVTNEAVAEYTGYFIAWGDSSPGRDIDPVSVDQIVGKWVATIPKVGLVTDWFLTGGGIIYLIAIIATVVLAVYFWNDTKDEPAKAAEGEAPATAEEPTLEDNVEASAPPSEGEEKNPPAAPKASKEDGSEDIK